MSFKSKKVLENIQGHW